MLNIESDLQSYSSTSFLDFSSQAGCLKSLSRSRAHNFLAAQAYRVSFVHSIQGFHQKRMHSHIVLKDHGLPLCSALSVSKSGYHLRSLAGAISLAHASSASLFPPLQAISRPSSLLIKNSRCCWWARSSTALPSLASAGSDGFGFATETARLPPAPPAPGAW